MAFTSGKSTQVFHGLSDLSAYFSSVDITANQDLLDTTTFGVTGGGRTRIPGLKDGQVSLNGLADFAASAIDVILSATIGAAGAAVVTILPNGGTIGNRVAMLNARSGSYQLTTPVEAVVSTTAALQADGSGIDFGVSLHALGAEVGVVNSASVDNAASSANGGVGHLHVTAATVTTITIKIQHSTDNSVWVDLISFTAVTATVAERLAVTGTVNRYTRAMISVFTGTTLTYAVAFSRR